MPAASLPGPVGSRAVRPVPLVAVLVLPALAGCLTSPAGTGGPGTCSAVTIPPARGGDVYDYDAQGTFYSPLRYISTEWPSIDGPNGVVVPNGSSMTIRLADALEPTLTHYGNYTPGLQATYWFDTPSSKPARPARDLRLDPDNANPIQQTARAFQRQDGHNEHSTRWVSTIGKVPLLLAPLFWNRSLAEDTEGRYTTRDGPYPPSWQLEQREWIDWTVEDVDRDPATGRCRALVTFRAAVAGPGHTGRLALADGVPLPVAYRWDAVGPNFEATLSSWQRGAGPWLARFADPFGRRQTLADYNGSALTRRPTTNGTPYHGADVFPTELDRARQVARRNETARRWLRNHPDHRLYSIEHTKGVNRPSWVDYWNLVWMAPSTDKELSVGVIRRTDSPVPEAVRPRYEAHARTFQDPETEPPENLSAAPRPANWTTFAALERLFEGYYEGHDLELFMCRFTAARPYCSLASQRSDRVFQPGISDIYPPLIVPLEKGWVFDDSQNAANVSIGPPVR